MTQNISSIADLVMFLHIVPTTSGVTSVLASQDTREMVIVVKVGSILNTYSNNRGADTGVQLIQHQE